MVPAGRQAEGHRSARHLHDIETDGVGPARGVVPPPLHRWTRHDRLDVEAQRGEVAGDGADVLAVPPASLATVASVIVGPALSLAVMPTASKVMGTLSIMIVTVSNAGIRLSTAAAPCRDAAAAPTMLFVRAHDSLRRGG